MPPSAFEIGTKGPPESATQPTQRQSPAETDQGGPDYALDIYTAQSIPMADFEACFKLIEQTVANAYADSGMGWSATKKRREMRLPDMRYLILRRGQIDRDGDRGQLLGFLSFMVTYEDGKEVNYCYEIHMAPEAQGLGLGRQLMIRYEDIGRRIGLEKAMLTVFKSNAKAMRFYERLGYVVDDFSPEPRTLRNGTVKEPEYLILSKPLKGSASDGA